MVQPINTYNVYTCKYKPFPDWGVEYALISLKPDVYGVIFGGHQKEVYTEFKRLLEKAKIPILFSCQAFNALHDDGVRNRQTLVIFDVPENFDWKNV